MHDARWLERFNFFTFRVSRFLWVGGEVGVFLAWAIVKGMLHIFAKCVNGGNVCYIMLFLPFQKAIQIPSAVVF